MRIVLVLVASSWIGLCSSNSSNSTTPTACTIDGSPPESFESIDPVPEATRAGPALDDALDLYDRMLWADAIVRLEPIVNGSIPEPPGNRQRAEFALAIAYLRVDRTEEARSLLGVVVHDPHHAFRRRAADEICRLDAD